MQREQLCTRGCKNTNNSSTDISKDIMICKTPRCNLLANAVRKHKEDKTNVLHTHVLTEMNTDKSIENKSISFSSPRTLSLEYSFETFDLSSNNYTITPLKQLDPQNPLHPSKSHKNNSRMLTLEKSNIKEKLLLPILNNLKRQKGEGESGYRPLKLRRSNNGSKDARKMRDQYKNNHFLLPCL